MKKDITKKRLPEQMRERLRSDFRLIAEYASCKNKKVKLEELIADRNHVIRHPEEFLDAMSAVAGDKRYEQIKTRICERAEERKEDITMCLIAEELENRGIQKGFSKGRLEGAKSMKETVARNMFIRNMTEEDTAAVCEESLEQVQAWFAKWSTDAR